MVLLPPTKLRYMTDMFQLEDTAMIVGVQNLDDNKIALILDQTIFYPQGGGQPFDQGVISSDNNIFNVEEVRFKEGTVYHIGKIISGSFTKDMNVSLSVNKNQRIYNSKNHSAGHIIDIAIHNLGLELVPGKGYHFPVGAYVEYSGTLNESERNQLIEKLQREVNKLVVDNHLISVSLLPFDELSKRANYVPDYIPKDKPTRAMTIDGFYAIPCGGTHAKNTKEIGPITIEKIKNKKGNLRISYSIKP